jgi:hypothetical protein
MENSNQEKVKLTPVEQLAQTNEMIEKLTQKKLHIEDQLFNLNLKKQKLERRLLKEESQNSTTLG